jgi:hypothetical protein
MSIGSQVAKTMFTKQTNIDKNIEDDVLNVELGESTDNPFGTSDKQTNVYIQRF